MTKKTIEKNKKTKKHIQNFLYLDCSWLSKLLFHHPFQKISSLRLPPKKQKKCHHPPKFVCVPVFVNCAIGGQKCHV